MRKCNMLFASALLATGLTAQAASAGISIPGITGPSFALVAKQDHVSTPEGGSYLLWGYAQPGKRAQYPGPTMIVNEGDTVTVTLTNALPSSTGQNASITFFGIEGVTAACATPSDCVDGPITKEAKAYKTVAYTFVASRPGTFLYSSASNPALQTEMGLFGALIVRPAGFDEMDDAMRTAYGGADSAYDHEYLFLLSDMDPRIHEVVELQGVGALQATDYLTDYFPNYWFINGRNAPDTMAADFVSRLPTQPYSCMPRMHPGEKLLMRVLDAGHDLHPFHHHGNHARVIARDGFPLQSTPGASPIDLSFEGFTVEAVPGQTTDAIFTWTGKDLGWDIYGDEASGFSHTCDGDYDPVTKEYCKDHYKRFPVTLPEQQNLDFGAFWSGSPFLGMMGTLPPGFGTMNMTGGYTYMWHSHNEKEMTNYDVFPGGMMTMLIIEAPGTPITM